MHKIYFLSDIHGNLPALNAVIEAIGKNEFYNSQKYFLGDFVHFGPYNNEVLDLIANLENAQYIEGNHDIYCAKTELDYQSKYGEKFPELVNHIDWARIRITANHIKWLADLPRQIDFEIKEKKFLLFHGHLDDTEKKINIDDTKLQAYDFVICGHTHKPFITKKGTTTIINASSIGEPLDGDNRAAYLEMTINNNDSFEFEIKRVKYDIQKVIQDMANMKMPLYKEVALSLQKGSVM